MKSNHEVKERVKSLKLSDKNWVDNYIEIELLTVSLQMSEEEIKSLLTSKIKVNNYKSARVLMWILEDGINIWFN